MSQKTSYAKNIKRVPRAVSECRPKWAQDQAWFAHDYVKLITVICDFPGTSPQIVLLTSRSAPVNNPLHCPPTIIAFWADRELTGARGSRLWMSSRNRWLCEKRQSCSPAEEAANRNPLLTCLGNIDQWDCSLNRGFQFSRKHQYLCNKEMELQMPKCLLHCRLVAWWLSFFCFNTGIASIISLSCTK